jgi:hypothetical protein
VGGADMLMGAAAVGALGLVLGSLAGLTPSTVAG